MYIYILIAFIIVLFMYNILNLVGNINNNIEGMENKDLNNNISPQTIIYQNQGAIQNLKEQVENIMNQINNSIRNMANLSSDVREINKNVHKNTTLVNQSNELSKKNEQRLLNMAKKSEAAAKKAKLTMSRIPPLSNKQNT